MGKYQSGSDLPQLLEPLPWWHLGRFAPPAETISGTSIIVAGAVTLMLFRNPVVKALFRFEFNPLWLAVPATLLMLWIVWAGSKRPGHWWPRLWALALFLLCSATTVWGLWEMIRGNQGSPLLHSLSGLGLTVAVALIPRLFRLHPYSAWVLRTAPVSLVLVLGVSLPLAWLAQGRVIQKHEERLDSKIGEVKRAAGQIQSLTKPVEVNPTHSFRHHSSDPTLADISLLKILPDPADWQALALLKRQDAMADSMADLLQSIAAGITAEDAPKMALSRFYHDSISETRDTRWHENFRFSAAAARAGAYYRQLGRLLGDAEQAFSGSPVNDVYQQQQQDLQPRLDELSKQFGERWIADLVQRAQTPPLDWIKEVYIGSEANRIADLNRWKNMRWSEAQSLLGQHGCARDVVRLSRMERVLVPDRSEASGYRETTVTRYFNRVECYAYRPSANSDGLEMLAELHLVYKMEERNSPYQVSLLFEEPPAFSGFQEQLMATLADAAREQYGVQPDYARGADPTSGFSIHHSNLSFSAKPFTVDRQTNVKTLEVQVF